MQQNIKFENSRGELLAGVLHTPDTAHVLACAVFAHCFTCTKNIKAAVNIAQTLANQGIAVLRFDFTGLGQSAGDFSDTHFSSNVQDLVDAAGYLAAELEPPSILVGHSLGGTAVLTAAHRLDSVRAVATIGSPADAEHVLHLLDDDIDSIEKNGEAQVHLAGRPFRIRRDFIDDLRGQAVSDSIRSLRRALLVMHSPVDELVPIEQASKIYASALHPKSFVSLDKADHLLSDERDSRYAGTVLAAWAARYIATDVRLLPPAKRVAGAVVVQGRQEDMFLSAVNANGHPLLADEPEKSGGMDLGPNPYDFLSTALGACTVMTLNMYARRKQLPLEQVEVVVRHDRIHAVDCESCESESGTVDRLSKKITLTGDLTPQQLERLMQIADMCPVHKTLHNEINIISELV